MKLRKLEISGFKNLRNFRIKFGKTLTTVLLGQNGTGKSNLLEALIIIFRDLDIGATPEFKYKLDYECRGNGIHIDADPTRPKREQVQVRIEKPGEWTRTISYTQFYSNSERQYLPNYVFGYYSGPSNRMEKHFDKHQARFYKDLLDGKEKPLRPFLYARLVHSQFALLSFFNVQDKQILDFLNKYMGIEALLSVLFIMRKPPWDSKKGDSRFWNARGVVSLLLAQLYELALAPMRLEVRIEPEFASKKTLEHLYLYLSSAENLKKLAEHYENQQEFFKALESTYISKILSEVRIGLKIRNADGSLTFRDMSEGEQQLLMVLGLLRFTKQDEVLFLLDEPDTHLNPAWSIQYLDFMKQVVGDQLTSHVIMTTHNPLVISSLERKDVRIMRRDGENGDVYDAEEPEEDPQGMGVAAILTSDLFGLRSTLDKPTQDSLDRRRELAAKDDEDLDEEDLKELATLNEQLSGLDFSITIRDPLYQDFASEYRDFVRKFTSRAETDLKQGILFTEEQRQRQRELTREILQEIKESQGQQI